MNSLMRYGSLKLPFPDRNCCWFTCLKNYVCCQCCSHKLWELKVFLHFCVSQVWLGHHRAAQLDDALRGRAAEPRVRRLSEGREHLRPQRKSQCRRNCSYTSLSLYYLVKVLSKSKFKQFQMLTDKHWLSKINLEVFAVSVSFRIWHQHYYTGCLNT